jgi:hypothetical protein
LWALIYIEDGGATEEYNRQTCHLYMQEPQIYIPWFVFIYTNALIPKAPIYMSSYTLGHAFTMSTV